MVKRQVDLKVLDAQKAEPAAKGRVRQVLKLRQGLSDDLARDVVKRVKGELPKLQSRIEGEKVRISGKSRDDLQSAIRLLKEADLPVPLQFTNYR
jgi:cyclic-di-GMP-binding protein